MSGAESASVGQKRKTFNLSEREELVRHLLAGSEDGVLKHGAYANPGMIMNRPLPRVGTPFFFIECDVLTHALRSTGNSQLSRSVFIPSLGTIQQDFRHIANQGMIAHHPPLWNDFFFSCLQCDI